MSVLTALVVLVGRQALIILLIIVRHLRFAAMILPKSPTNFSPPGGARLHHHAVFYPLVAVLFSAPDLESECPAFINQTGVGWKNQLIKLMSLVSQTFPLACRLAGNSAAVYSVKSRG